MARQENEREKATKRIQEWLPTANNYELLTEFQNEAAIPITDPDYFVVIETKGMLKAEILRRMAG